ncbi:MAG: excinuclease ABC subunit B [Verrucomicrobia bacterium 13_1_20CM_54_28]|nr:MAG: excinuclease ABC subunit B [Verrucomicrobia bacterium 13_2_20CM_2_54_15]OLD73512.1 MAG: excinuclease ABC subunit B [Verrucomicrobia bacterium 13_1_20CM_54_28]OLD86660.1 MAG: excinuclease ABC subunit B [Verrucomicrobia bacterium 13_1_20CM_4_54_11]
MSFQLESNYKPKGDQAQAIGKLIKSVESGNRHQTLLGVTGSGKTFSIANVIQELDRPSLVISHNKTLAAQLYSEFKQFFPRNAVEYFVSYFDYYQPEAYIPRSDTYIEKDSSINEEIERLRLAATSALLSRRDTIVVASVSCIYGITSPEDYLQMLLTVKQGQHISREAVLSRLIEMLYERNDMNFSRGRFRVRGDVVEVYPGSADEEGVRIEFFGDEIEAITKFDPLTGHAHESLSVITFYPAKQFVTPADKLNRALRTIREELEQRIVELESQNKLLEAQRLRMRTEYDLEMLQEMGFCNGIENYSRHLSGRPPGSKPYTIIDFFPKDFLVVIDESHATIPQIGGMYEGDRSRKTVLVNYGFRLPSALDNRPLNFDEFMKLTNQTIYVSATPAEFEIQNSVVGNKGYIPHKRQRIGEQEIVPFVLPGEKGSTPIDREQALNSDKRRARAQRSSSNSNVLVSRTDEPPEKFDVHTPGAPLVVEQIIRPTGLLDPKITLKPLKNQIDETIELCRQRVEKSERILVTTLTKRTAEDLADYLRDVGLKVRYLHSDIDAIERVEILRGLRAADFDILVGINLLREGLDLPEVSLVCILDADKEGFLRSQTSLIQTAGRAARHVNGEVVLFADQVTQSMEALISISEYRRAKQMEYNEKHGITPQTVRRAVQESLHTILRGREIAASVIQEAGGDFNVTELLRELEEEMQEASANLEFERAALLRDQIMEVKGGTGISKIEPKRRTVKYSRRGTGRRRSRV